RGGAPRDLRRPGGPDPRVRGAHHRGVRRRDLLPGAAQPPAPRGAGLTPGAETASPAAETPARPPRMVQCRYTRIENGLMPLPERNQRPKTVLAQGFRLARGRVRLARRFLARAPISAGDRNGTLLALGARGPRGRSVQVPYEFCREAGVGGGGELQQASFDVARKPE